MTTHLRITTLLFLELVAGCGHVAPPNAAARPEPATVPGEAPRVEPVVVPGPTDRTAGGCVQGGRGVVVEICRIGDDLTWIVTNHTATPLWVFVAPAAPGRNTARENAFVATGHGVMLLRKIQLPWKGMDEPIFSAAIRLPPRASDHGTIPIGARPDPRRRNFWPAGIAASTAVKIVLEVGYSTILPQDRPYPDNAAPDALVLLRGFDGTRQQFSRTPALAWIPWR